MFFEALRITKRFAFMINISGLKIIKIWLYIENWGGRIFWLTRNLNEML